MANSIGKEGFVQVDLVAIANQLMRTQRFDLLSVCSSYHFDTAAQQHSRTNFVQQLQSFDT